MRAERVGGWPRPQRGWLSSSWFPALLFLCTLWTLAIAQSIYSMLAANPNFLGVRLSSNGQLLALVAVFNLLPPLLLFLVWLVLHFLREQWGRGFLGLVAAALLLLLFWQAHNLYLGARWHNLANSYLLWILPAALLGLACYRSPQAVRSFAFVASPIMILLPVAFLGRSWSTHVEFVAGAETALREAVTRAAPSERPAIFLLLFDELSLPVLLDEHGQIDGQSYPHFQQLTRQSTWFRQATANGDFTNNSLPTLLTGNLPRSGGLNPRTYPENLFTLLEPHYQLFVYETWSKFCRPDRYHCLRDTDRLEASNAAFLLDVFYLFAVRTVPRGVNLQLPDVRKNWGFFHNPRVAVELALRRFEKFLETVAALEQPRGVFVFFHNSLPHSPYWVTPSGEIQEGEPAAFDPGQRGAPAQVNAVLVRYKDQVRFVDAELGRFLDLLRKRGLYDASLVIVTSDHGVSYDARAPGRDLVVVEGRALNAEPLLRVPLFIKRPFQRDGIVSDREVQLIDMMPTVAEVVGVEVPWTGAGRSVFSPTAEPRNRVAFDRRLRRYDFPADPRQGWRVLQKDVNALGKNTEEPE